MRGVGVGVGAVLLDIAIIVLAAKLAGEAFERLRQPAVVGELLAGALLSASLLGPRLGLPDLAADAAAPAAVVVEALAGLGAILLLFEVGLESDVRRLGKVGASSAVVALVGVVASFAAGYAASVGMAHAWPGWRAADATLPPHLLHLFMGAALTATSVGITARVLADMGRLRTAEARIILGAAVLDDVAGLLVLAVVAALIDGASGGGPVDAWRIARVAGTAMAFLAAVVALGLRFVPRAYDAAVGRFRVRGFPLALAFGFALLMAYAASRAHLADIVGAFAAGLLLARTRDAHRLFEAVRPVGSLLIPVFFVTIGMRVDLQAVRADALPVVLGALVLAAAGTVAKLACGRGVVRGQARRLPVGVGMVPRGEVGLIFATLGLATGLLGPALYGAVVLAMLLTTLVTPVWLARLGQRFTPDPEGPADEHLAQTTDA